MVAIAIVVHRPEPLAEGKGIMQGIAAGAAAGADAAIIGQGILMPQVAAIGNIKQITQAKRVIQRQRNIALIFPRGLAARIIRSNTQPKRQQALPPYDNYIAFVWLCARFNPDIRLGAGYPLEVFQPLLQIAQVEDIACRGGELILKRTNPFDMGGFFISQFNPYAANFPGNYRELQPA